MDSDVLLGPYDDISLKDWPKEGKIRVKVCYDEGVYDAVVLQVR